MAPPFVTVSRSLPGSFANPLAHSADGSCRWKSLIGFAHGSANRLPSPPFARPPHRGGSLSVFAQARHRHGLDEYTRGGVVGRSLQSRARGRSPTFLSRAMRGAAKPLPIGVYHRVHTPRDFERQYVSQHPDEQEAIPHGDSPEKCGESWPSERFVSNLFHHLLAVLCESAVCLRLPVHHLLFALRGRVIRFCLQVASWLFHQGPLSRTILRPAEEEGRAGRRGGGAGREGEGGGRGVGRREREGGAVRERSGEMGGERGRACGEREERRAGRRGDGGGAGGRREWRGEEGGGESGGGERGGRGESGSVDGAVSSVSRSGPVSSCSSLARSVRGSFASFSESFLGSSSISLVHSLNESCSHCSTMSRQAALTFCLSDWVELRSLHSHQIMQTAVSFLERFAELPPPCSRPGIS